MQCSLRIAALFLLIVSVFGEEYFVRNAKWSKLAPSGGSLVSGRGNFRPGFNTRDWRMAIAEPSFGFRKRSAGPVHAPSRFVEAMVPIDNSLYEYLRA